MKKLKVKKEENTKKTKIQESRQQENYHKEAS